MSKRMTKLFALMLRSSIPCDTSNDDMMQTDTGLCWRVYTEPLPIFPHIVFVRHAVELLGEVYQGHVWYPLEPGEPPYLEIYLTANYQDELVEA